MKYLLMKQNKKNHQMVVFLCYFKFLLNRVQISFMSRPRANREAEGQGSLQVVQRLECALD